MCIYTALMGEKRLLPTQDEILGSLDKINSQAENLLQKEEVDCLAHLQDGDYKKEDIKKAAKWIKNAKQVLSESRSQTSQDPEMFKGNEHLKNVQKLNNVIRALEDSPLMRFITYTNQSYESIDKLLSYSEAMNKEDVSQRSTAEFKIKMEIEDGFNLSTVDILKRFKRDIDEEVPFILDNGDEIFKVITFLTRDRREEDQYYGRAESSDLIAKNPDLLSVFIQIGSELIDNVEAIGEDDIEEFCQNLENGIASVTTLRENDNSNEKQRKEMLATWAFNVVAKIRETKTNTKTIPPTS
jgi:hypothetical protein